MCPATDKNDLTTTLNLWSRHHHGVLTGGTLFIGDVSRPDLLTSFGLSAEELVGRLYDSSRNKLLTLPDSTRVFSARGAGSSCDKPLSNKTESTIGVKRATNYAPDGNMSRALIRNTWNTRILDELTPQHRDVIIPKHR